LWNAAGKLDNFDAALYFATRVAQNFAMLSRY